MVAQRPKAYIVRLYLGSVALFFVNKMAVRSWVLGSDLPEFFHVFVRSVPNTLEAIVGMVMVGGILTAVKLRASPRLDTLSPAVLTVLAAILTGTYVLSQEFKLHDLGGLNVYDPYDVVASVLGLVLTSGLFMRYGIVEEGTQAPSPM
jgi:hypothetical protein